MIAKNPFPTHMRKVLIPKGNSGKVRLIYVPSAEEKNALRELLPRVTELSIAADSELGVAHGFRPGRSPVTMAVPHIGKAFTLTMDLEEFFDSISASHLTKVPGELLAKLLVDGAPRQGLPTSPALANIAGAKIDKAIKRIIAKDTVYTRYADDMAFSFDDPSIIEELLEKVPEIVRRCHFKLAPEKTHLQLARDGRRIICGIGVGDRGIHPTREMKRRLRAARHQDGLGVEGARNQVNGLNGWCLMRRPGEIEGNRKYREELKAFGSHFKVKIPLSKIPDKGEDVWLDQNTLITGDPIYMLGASTWTNGWTSCIGFPNGARRRKTVGWVLLRGTRIAATLSNKTMTIAGVTRRVMINRALLHTFRKSDEEKEEVLAYDKVYGFEPHLLRETMRKANIGSVKRYQGTGMKVVGHMPASEKPPLDTLHPRSKTGGAGSPWRGKRVLVFTI